MEDRRWKIDETKDRSCPMAPSVFHLPSRLFYAATISPLVSGSGAGPHTYAVSLGVCSARLPREMTIPTGSCSISAGRIFAIVPSVLLLAALCARAFY
jgi:hypothetical protein